MCDRLPGDRCAVESRKETVATAQAYEAISSQPLPPVSALVAPSALAAWHTVPASTHVTVIDPDDQWGAPLYDGQVKHASKYLRDGQYQAVGADGERPMVVHVGAPAAYNLIAAESNIDVEVSALTFDEAEQGCGEPVYWVTEATLRKLQRDAHFARKAEFDKDYSSAYITFEDGEPVQHQRQDDGSCITTPLPFRLHAGREYYSLEGWDLTPAHPKRYETPCDDELNALLRRAHALSPDDGERLAEAYLETVGPEHVEAFSVVPWCNDEPREDVVRALEALPSTDPEWQDLVNGGYSHHATEAAKAAAIALGARHLIGTNGWGQDEYDLLTAPWRRTIGPLHPNDPPLPADSFF